MSGFSKFLLAIALCALTACSEKKISETLIIAVASNFAPTLKDIIGLYESETGNLVKVSIGSTSKLYAQIRNGAPYDIFFAADNKHPRLLEENNLIIKNSRQTYAFGQLVLWQSQGNITLGLNELLSEKVKYIAIANPKLAPYGEATKQMLQEENLWDKLINKFVYGENIAQTMLFVESENADLGFVALSQVINRQGSKWVVPVRYHNPIEQQMVQLRDSPLSKDFLKYMNSIKVRSLILSQGYKVP